MRGVRFVAVVLVLAALAAGEADGAQQATQPNLQIVAINPGIGGRYRENARFPVAVELFAQFEPVSGSVELESEGFSEISPVYRVQFELSPGARYRYFLYPHCASAAESYSIVIRDSGGGVARREELAMTAHPPESYLVGVVGNQGIPGIAARKAEDTVVGMETAFIPFEYLPTRACGYEAIDVLVWAHPDPAGLIPGQDEAIRDWVLGGGRLVIALGDTWQPAAATFIAELLPGTVTGVELARDLSELEAVGGAPIAGGEMLIATLDGPRGRVLKSAGKRPLVVSSKAGFGEVVFLAFDPTRTPFPQWSAAGEFWDWLLGLKIGSGGETEASSALGPRSDSPKTGASEQQVSDVETIPLLRTGDVTGSFVLETGGGSGASEGQIAEALNEFAEVKPVPFSWLVLFLSAYVILVGPVDYFVLRRMKHLEWTWFTFPAVTIAATLLAFGFITATRAARVYINQVTLADWSADGRVQRVLSMAALITPQNDRYDVSYDTPGADLRVVDPYAYRDYGRSLAATSYEVVDVPERGAEVRDILMPVWSPRTFLGRWTAREFDEPPLMASITRLQSGELTGTITNASNLLFQHVYFIHRDGVCALGRIEPGASVELPWAMRRSMVNFLKTARSDAMGDYAIEGAPGFPREMYGRALKASVSLDRRFFPLENLRKLAPETVSYEGGFAPELSVLPLVEAGQAVLIGIAPGSLKPIGTKAAYPVRCECTVYRVCAPVAGD